jgi:DNA-binding IclR family transcriptional regulator
MRKSPAVLGGVKVLHKALDALEKVRESYPPLTLSGLALRMGMPKPTVYRIVSTLEMRGYLTRQADGTYRVARRLLDVQHDSSTDERLVLAARPVMQRLSQSCQETVNLGILDAAEAVVICTIESPLAVRMSSKIGSRRFLHSTALGKVLLAGLPDREVQRLIGLKGLSQFTPKTLTTEAALMAEIDRVRQQGFAIDDQEQELEGRCVGASITGPDNKTAAALSVSGPVYRTDRARLFSLVKELRAACDSISKALR